MIRSKHANTTASVAVKIKITKALVNAKVVWLQNVKVRHNPNKHNQANSLKKKNLFKSLDQVNNSKEQNDKPK